MSDFTCHYCGTTKLEIKKFLSHLELQHGHLPNFSAACHVCKKSYRIVDSLRKHYRRQHQISNSSDIIPVVSSGPSDTEKEVLDVSFPDSEHGVELTETLNEKLSALQKHITLFVLKMQEKHLLPNVIQESIVNNVKQIVEEVRVSFVELITSEIRDQGLCISESSDLHTLIHQKNLFNNLYDHCSTTYRLQKYCQETLYAVFPTTIELPLPLKGRKVQFQYVSILSTLSQILSTGNLLSLIISEQSCSSSSAYSDYKSGVAYKSHSIFSQYKTSLRIHLYIDEFEIVNPLGSKKSLHKLCGVYFMLGNFGPKFNTKLKHIFLCTLFRNNLLQEGVYTYDDILQPLIKDLNTLSREGLSLKLHGSTITLYGALATVSADNLGAHQLAGFTKSFSSGRVCRFCMVLHKDLSNILSEKRCTLRTKEAHTRHLQAIQETPDLVKSTYGVTSRCPLEDLEYFSTVDFFIPDLMHDFLEGVVPLIIRLILKSFHDANILTNSQLNDKLLNFSVGGNDKKSKPTSIPYKCMHTQGASIPGKAIEKWCLFRLLPLIIANHIPDQNEYWELYLKCRTIGDILFAPSIASDDVDLLNFYIEDFLECFVAMFPNQMTPKLHFLLHYPTQIKKHRPLRHLWCMRFEGKHQYFKRVAQQLCNFRNVALSLARRHQMRLCWELTSEDFLQTEVDGEGTASLQFLSLTRNIQQTIINYANIDFDEVEKDEVVLTCQTLHMNAVKYAVKDCFILELIELEEVPVFFKIFNIVNFRSKWLLYGCILLSDAFNEHMHSYEVQTSDIWCLIEPGQEIDYHALDVYNIEGTNYITLHHKPFLA